jgi:hypothetical protein
MTPKEKYEQRKAERKARRESNEPRDFQQREDEMTELFDRLVTAVERIADALEPDVLAYKGSE